MNEEKPIGFRINEVSRLFKNQIRESAQKDGISCTYLSIFGYLKHHNHVTQKEICEAVKMKAPTISLTLQNMEDEGFINRVKDDADSRKTIVVLTEKGKEISDSIRVYFDYADEVMQNALTKEELSSFYEYLDKITKALEKEGK